ncbi:MAG: diguanylate cyclase [Nitrospiria bacterium]
MRLHILEKRRLNSLLSRERHRRPIDENAPALDLILKEIVRKANQFVPSEAGSILLDDPIRKKEKNNFQELVFVACFGVGSSALPGIQLPLNAGIIGATYLSGKPYLGKNLTSDKTFVSKRDQISRFKTRSIICAPIIIEKSVCGIIELINRKGKKNYSEEELKLLEIFAGYTSTLIQNVLYAKTHIEMSKKDGLTGLYNDRYFYIKLDQDIRQAKIRRDHDLILLFIDMDHFKYVNDAFGHLTGSRVLQDVGNILKKVVPSQGTTIARYGGDEFIIIFTQIPLAEVLRVAQAICDAIHKFELLNRPYLPKGTTQRLKRKLTCSIGLASLKDHTDYKLESADIRQTLIQKADAAMYRAKLNGKNRVCIASPG